jgi:tagatose 6-phosphate kinase
MICTVSLNPALDKYLRLPRLRRGEHQEVQDAVTSAGGKAINVAGVLRTLGETVRLTGFFGGYTGQYLLQEVAREGIEAEPVLVAGTTRTAFVVVEDGGVETEIVEPGAPVASEELNRLRQQLRRIAREASAVVLSGSVPPGCPENVYQLLIEDCGGHCPVLLDTSRSWLTAVAGRRLQHPPTLIKPNRREAEHLLGHALASAADFLQGVEELQTRGIACPVISDSGGGLYAGTPGGVLHGCAPKVKVVNSVGSGDATVAGFAYGLAREWPIEQTIRLATACGTANVLTKECAQVLRPDVDRLLDQVQVEPVAARVSAERR